MASSSSSSSEDDSCGEYLQNKDRSERVYLKILKQPCDHYRFRYLSEMVATHGFLPAKNSKNHPKLYPTVELRNFRRPAIIKCSLAQWDNDNGHVHKLKENKSEDIKQVGPAIGYTAVFDNLSIIQLRKAEVPAELRKSLGGDIHVDSKEFKKLLSKIDLNKVRLKFSAHNTDDGETLCPPVYSSVIASQKSAATRSLKICRMSRASGSVLGGDEVYLLVEKVKKDEIGVSFFQLNEEREVIWRADGIFNENEDVHFQFAIVVKTPPYRDLNITKDVPVFIELYRKNTKVGNNREFEMSEERSNKLSFTYIPEFKKSPYSSVINNDAFFSQPLKMPATYDEEIDIINAGQTFPSIRESKYTNYRLASFEEPKSPLQLIDSNDGENKCHTNIFSELRPNLGNLKEYFEIFDSTGDIMDFEELQADGIVKKTKNIGNPTTTAQVELKTDIDIEDASLDSFLDDEDDDGSICRSSSSHKQNQAKDLQNAANYKNSIPSNKGDADDKPTIKKINKYTEKDTKLLSAILNDDEKLVESLVNEGCSLSVCDINANNALHCGVNSNSCLPVLLKACQGMIDEAINERNHDGRTPLHLAVLQNSSKKVQLLLSKHANHDVVDEMGDSALHLAVQAGFLNIVEILLESVAEIDVDKTDGKGQTALQIVCSKEDSANNQALVELLLQKGANVSATVVENLSALHLSKEKPKIMGILKNYFFS